ncbi:uncharacterized protein LOC134443443 [Engraulis encrasicolus]|uniref:uncharacterized protein LOC134443443 n=1 Tax=Engraulis encrasicolus TaxID=184585 RepID=UPI002FCF41F5
MCCQSELCTRPQRKRKLTQSENAKLRDADKKRQRYHNDDSFRQKKLLSVKEKYHKDECSKQKKRQHSPSLKRYNISKQRQRVIDCAIDTFRKNVSRGPEHVCSCCHRLLFRRQVIECKPQNYANKRPEVAKMAKRCITTQYLHVCDCDCQTECYLAESPATKLWICHTCHQKILSGTLPQESVTNNLELHAIPPELKCLNSLEQHLIAKNICFMKLLCLPRGRQRGCHGPCVCVPINSQTVTNVLPRDESDDKMIRIKLKRKISYKNFYEFQFVHTERVRNALRYLIKNNFWYDDVILNDQWLNSLDGTDHENDETDDKDNVENSDDEEHDNEEKEEELTYIKDQSGLVSDTSLQPIDIGSEIVDQHFQDILSMAPAEGNSPVSLLSDKTNESKCFPVLYPLGGPTFHSERESKITLSRYLNTRLLNADGRFARNTDFLFYAQYISEVNQVQNSISIALRKGSQKDVSPETLLNSDSLKTLLHNNEGYKFLRGIRGTPPYWMSVQKDLFAMIRQLSIPTFFASFSSADLRWPDFLSSLQRAEGKEANVADLDWSDKTKLVRSNPVTTARLFDERWHSFLKDVILSPAEPIGKIIDHFYRVEFQQRGSPHIHALFWVANAPKIDTHSDAEVTAFIDKYITCQLPTDKDSELYETVNSVQKHSTRHSKTCRKKNTVCRFHFPRPPSQKTFITRSVSSEDADETKRASDIINTVRAALTSPDFDFKSTAAFFQSLGIEQSVFEWAYNMWTTKKSIVMKRNPSDIWVNQYNKHLLRAWQGNMDIQFVTDAHSAAVYILSYVTKGEMEPGLLLQRTQMEALNGNVDAKAAFRQLGSVYLHNREVSAQEAVYRLTQMHLKECSRDVQFIPVGENPMRMSLPLHMLQAQTQHMTENNENIWMTNIVERYTNRPQSEEMKTLCLATFCSEYRVLSKSEVSKNKESQTIIELNNNFGFLKKRTRSQPAVVRYPRFSPTKDPEKYYHSLLQLFLPHYEILHLKPPPFETYEHFYNNGAVKCGTDVQTVKSIVDDNKALFEKDSDELDKAEQLLQTDIDLTDAWAILAPEAEDERLHCLQLMKNKVVEDENDDDIATNIPDLRANPQTVYSLETNNVTMPRQDALDLLRSLNEEQSAVFYAVRHWCLQKRFGKNPEPLRLFLTGGAGVGKSHLIKAIHYESTRLLQDDEHPDELPVILTAPTGVAAYNIRASTIHNTFSINANATLPYQPLGDEKVNCLRNKMRNLQILIIDEISMVDHKLLSYISGRLRQIKQTKDYSLFGKISVICVGDFYQLKPVKGTPLYADNRGVNLWENNFEIVELTTVVRQQNATFAETLNRLRVRKKTQALNSRDVRTLKQREIEDDHSILHIYATNAEVQEYNVKKLNDTCPDVIQILAQDFQRNPKTGRMEKMAGFHTKVFNSCLPKCVQVGIGARILLLKNLNVQDGLTNGAAGVIVNIIDGDDDNDLPKAIYVEFDDPNVGRIQRAQSNRQSERSTELQVQEDQISNNGGVRRQYPIGLAWAVTVHKCQGLTVERAFVSLRKIFAAGQAYVALSRVKNLEGLIIDELKDSAIYCDEKVQAAMENMPKFNCGKSISNDENTGCRIALHNVQSLKAHIKDIEAHGTLMKADCICLTETWLNADSQDIPQLPGFTFQHNPRINCYGESEAVFAQLKQKKGGGVGIYCGDKLDVQVSLPQTCNLECLYFEIPHVNVIAAVLYRPRSYAIGVFRQQLLQVIHEVEKYPGKKLIMGDLNEDIFVSSTIANLLDQYGYKQCVETFTSEKNTLIDHVYFKGAENIIVEVVPTYFSFHEAILISLH